MLWRDWSVISRSTVSFMYSRLLYEKQEKNPGLFHQANIHACFIRVLLALHLPAIHIPLLDGINQSTLVYQDQGNLASALVVCVWGGGGSGWLRQNCYDGDVRT